MENHKHRNMQVVLRVRPLNRSELEQNQRNIIQIADANTIIFDPDEDEDEFFFHGTKQSHRDITKRVNKNLTMVFDQVFGYHSTNMEIFEFSMKPLVLSAMQGYNCSAFVYGATGAGKTFTMLGNEENSGIAYLTMRELFEQIAARSNEQKFDIGISYLEVYNEQVMNLLTKSGPLKLREDANGVVVSGLNLKTITNADELLSLLALGNRNRTQHPTDANAESSRSHAIFQVHIRMKNRSTGEKRMVKLSMIDLAGSERGSSTKCTGQRFKEGASINKSLLALGNCINKLADGSKHIPYRDSNMTRILKDSLGGNCKTVMIANISPSSLTFEDTYNTLRYASRAQKIRTTTLTKNALKNDFPKEYYVHKLAEKTTEVETLEKRIKTLESQIGMEQVPSTCNSRDIKSSFEDLYKEAVPWQQLINKVYDALHHAQSNYFPLHSKEQILKVRTKFKEYLEENRKAFNIDGEFMDRDIARAQASIGKFSKQIETFEADRARWMQRYKDARGELLKIEAEIAKQEHLSMILKPYLKWKQSELEKAQCILKSDHYAKLLRLYSTETSHDKKTLQLSSEIMQQNYRQLSARLLLTEDMQSKYNQLYKMHDQRGIRFASAEVDRHQNDDCELFTYPILDEVLIETHSHDATSHSKSNAGPEVLSAPNLPKAKRTLNVDDSDFMPKRFAYGDLHNRAGNVIQTSTNENNQIMNSVSSTDETFSLKPKKLITTKTRSILKETSANYNMEMVSGKSILKPFLTSKSVIGLQEKENKRMPTIARKSPKRCSPANTLKRKASVRQVTKPSENILKRLGKTTTVLK